MSQLKLPSKALSDFREPKQGNYAYPFAKKMTGGGASHMLQEEHGIHHFGVVRPDPHQTGGGNFMDNLTNSFSFHPYGDFDSIKSGAKTLAKIASGYATNKAGDYIKKNIKGSDDLVEKGKEYLHNLIRGVGETTHMRDLKELRAPNGVEENPNNQGLYKKVSAKKAAKAALAELRATPDSNIKPRQPREKRASLNVTFQEPRKAMAPVSLKRGRKGLAKGRKFKKRSLADFKKLLSK